VQAVDLDLHAAAAEAHRLGAAHDAERVGAAVGAGGLAGLVEGDRAAVVAEHHREAGGAAVGGLHLLDVRHAAAALAAELAQGLGEVGLDLRRGLRLGLIAHQNLRSPGINANTIRSERTRTSAPPIMPSW
jgi:hypothetical protein